MFMASRNTPYFGYLIYAVSLCLYLFLFLIFSFFWAKGSQPATHVGIALLHNKSQATISKMCSDASKCTPNCVLLHLPAVETTFAS